MIEPGSVHPDLQSPGPNENEVQPDYDPGQVYGVTQRISGELLTVGPILKYHLEEMAETLIRAKSRDSRNALVGVWSISLQIEPVLPLQPLDGEE